MDTCNIVSRREVFEPQAANDDPCDVILVTKGGKEFKAHKKVLSEASPFFEKLLNSDMRESKEGIVRLEMLTEPVLGDMLEFIYTGKVSILAEDNARHLVAMADYLFLPQLKALPGKGLRQQLDASNCISTYYFAEIYHCEELASHAKQFTLENFTTVAKTEDFMNMSSQEVEMWLSSDEINVSAEEDVFKIILTWIEHDKGERSKYFAELFRCVRLVYVPRDYIRRDIMGNKLVKDSRACLDLVMDAMKLTDSKHISSFSVTPRKSLEIPVILVTMGKEILCYFPREDKWYRSDNIPPRKPYRSFSCHGKLYCFTRRSGLIRYDSLTNYWTSLSYREIRILEDIFVTNEGEIYAFVSDSDYSCCKCTWHLAQSEDAFDCGKLHPYYITKYNPESNSWEDISKFDFGYRIGICVVVKDNFIYFIGGKEDEYLTNVDRYDLNKNMLDKMASMQQAREWAYGAVAHGKIFVTDDFSYYRMSDLRDSNDFSFKRTVEMYNEATNEWQFISSVTGIQCTRPRKGDLICVDGQLYALDSYLNYVDYQLEVQIECYDPETNEWYQTTQAEIAMNRRMRGKGRYWYRACAFFCSMRVFQESCLRNVSCPINAESRKCLIM